ncbi:MAG: hypothetical protein ABGX05_06175, partial [Pirellulaceae bacterium]
EQPSKTIGRLGMNQSNVGGIRYRDFEDGTQIDLKHFLAAAKYGDKYKESIAKLLGWFVEVKQAANGDPSGHPFGGNEDLQSNSDGADFGDDYLSNSSSKSLGRQVTDYLEGQHGEITGVRGEGK